MRGKRPTKKESIFLTSCKLDFNQWLVTKGMPLELHLKHRTDDTTLVIRKYE